MFNAQTFKQQQMLQHYKALNLVTQCADVSYLSHSKQ
jgi:hypothetical protein